MLYIFMFLVLAIFLSENIFLKKYEKKILYFLCVFLCFIASFRYETGGDWPGYYSIYNGVPIVWKNFLRYIDTNRIEKGFLLLVYLIKKFGLDKQYLFIFSTTFAFITMLKALKMIFKKNITAWKIFLTLYFGQLYFYKDFIIMRQSIAASLALLGVAYFLEDKIKKFVLCIFLGFLFHKSILAVLPIIILSKIKLKRNQMLLILLIVLMMYFLKIPYLKILVMKIHPEFPKRYLQNFNFDKSQLFFIFWFLILLLSTLYRKNTRNIYINKKNIYLKNIYFFSLITPFFIYESKEIMLRFDVYLSLFKFVSISLLISYIYKKERGQSILLYKITITTFILFFTGYSLKTKVLYSKAYNPYQNYLLKNNHNYNYKEALKRLEKVQKDYIKSLKK